MKVEARFGILGDGTTAVIEMSAASGLALLKPQDRSPMRTTTYGTGELLMAAAAMGVSKIIWESAAARPSTPESAVPRRADSRFFWRRRIGLPGETADRRGRESRPVRQTRAWQAPLKDQHRSRVRCDESPVRP